MSNTNQTTNQYSAPARLRLVVLTLVVVSLIYVLFNMKDWLKTDPNIDTKGWIAFVSDRNESSDIFIAKPDGSIIALTDDEAEDDTPVWLPNGKRIIFSSLRTTEKMTKSVFQLWSIRPDGSQIEGLTVGGGAKQMPVLSPDEKKILHISAGWVTITDVKDHSALQVMPPSEKIQQWREYFGENFGFSRACWCPVNTNFILAQLPSENGNSIIFSATDLIRGNSDEGITASETAARSPEGLPQIIIAAEMVNFGWSPTETKFVVSYHNPVMLSRILQQGPKSKAPFVNGIMMVEVLKPGVTPKSKNVLQLGNYLLEYTLHNIGDDVVLLEPNFSPDGRQIAFVLAHVNEQGNIIRDAIATIPSYAFEADLSPVEPTVIVRGYVGSPVWSSDNSKLAYTVLNQDGKRDIWTIDINGTNAKNITNGKGDNFAPQWSPK